MSQLHYALSPLLLRLYRFARTAAAPEFKDQAFALIKEYLPFESGLWGALVVTPAGSQVHWVFLDHQTMEMIVNWQKYHEHDPSHKEAIANFGHTITVNLKAVKEAARYHPKLLEHAHTYEICYALSTVTHDATLNLRNAISFYRGWSGTPFTEPERRFTQDLVPHLAEAWSMCAIQHVAQAAAAGPARGARALIDLTGTVHNAEPGFVDLICAEFPGWVGPRVPFTIAGAAAMADGKLFQGKVITVSTAIDMADGMRLISVQRVGAAGRLSQRERAVASEFAAGSTYKEIATRFGVSPATVRNQLRSAYTKLGVNRKVALLKELA